MEKYIHLEGIKTLSQFRGSEEFKNRVIIEDYFLADSGKRLFSGISGKKLKGGEDIEI